MTAMRAIFIFRSKAFNTDQPKDNFINPGCYGEDLVAWIGEQLKSRGVLNVSEPKQEDFGWYLEFDTQGDTFQAILTLRPAQSGGDWIGRIEKSAGLLDSLFGKRGDVPPEAIEAIRQALAHDLISDLRWYSDQDFRTESNPATDPFVAR